MKKITFHITKPTKKQWKIIVVATALLILIAYIGIGWYFSNKLFSLSNQKVEYDHTVTNVNVNEYRIKGGAYDVDGIMGVIVPENQFVGILDKPTSLDKKTESSTRVFKNPSTKTLIPGERISLQGNIWTSNPKDALGVEYKNVTYKSPVGDMNAWLVPVKDNKKWTIAVHGIGASKTELLRFINPVISTGSNMLIINYRGDDDNPKPADGRNHFGDTEWQDVEAAVRYAKSQGAEEIQLYGVSLGGSLVENYLRRSSDIQSLNISHVVLDSPALNWNQILQARTKEMGFPGFLAIPGMQMAKLRAGIDFKRASTNPGSIRQKTLIIHNQRDTSVPQDASKKVAAAQPDKIQFADFGSAGHTRAWNNNPDKYNQLINNFLSQ